MRSRLIYFEQSEGWTMDYLRQALIAIVIVIVIVTVTDQLSLINLLMYLVRNRTQLQYWNQSMLCKFYSALYHTEYNYTDKKGY